MSLSWENYFLNLLDVVRSKSKDPSTKVGAIIFDSNNAIVSTGFNGFPIGVSDDVKRYEDRDTKYKFVVHAEMNAILLSARRGQKVEGCTILIDWYPCTNCAKAIIQSGIKEIWIDGRDYEKKDKYWRERWGDEILISKKMLQEAGISVRSIGEQNVQEKEK